MISRSPVLIAITCLAALLLFAQGTSDQEALKQANEFGVSAFRSRNFEAAVRHATKALGLTIKIYGFKHPETAQAYINAGAAYREAGLVEEAEKMYQSGVDAFLTLQDPNKVSLAAAYSSLAKVQLLRKRESPAEANYLNALSVADSQFGSGGKETLLHNLNLANFYASWKRFGKADDYYLKSYTIAFSNFDGRGPQVSTITANRSCLLESDPDYYNSKDFYKRLKEATKKGTSILYANASATFMPKPFWPDPKLKIWRPILVAIDVRIGSDGGVQSANVVCGPPEFARVSAAAAMNTKFPPQSDSEKFIHGGLLRYSFVP